MVSGTSMSFSKATGVSYRLCRRILRKTSCATSPFHALVGGFATGAHLVKEP
jgi:hypothetical protein